MNTQEITTKLGTNKGTPRSRVWIEGARLDAAGFTVGARYTRACFEQSMRLALDPAGPYKVSGKGNHPIIDITGKTVTERFNGTHVRVAFSTGVINIYNA